MKIFPRIHVVILLLVVVSAIAFADTINPKITVHAIGGGGKGPVSCPTSGCTDVGLKFDFTVPASGSDTLYFTNTSGVAWTSLALIEICKHGNCAIPAGDIKCHSYYFASCTTETLKNGNVEILLSGIHGALNLDRGIQNNQRFAISFNCPHGNCWPGGLDFVGKANNATTIPEPATIGLMATGLAALLSRRKRWKNRRNS